MEKVGITEERGRSTVLRRRGRKGARCTGTTVHAHVPDGGDCIPQTLFFDEKFLLDYNHIGSKVKQSTLPDFGYFDYLSSQEQVIYKRYNSVLEGVRPDERFHCPHPECLHQYTKQNRSGRGRRLALLPLEKPSCRILLTQNHVMLMISPLLFS